MTEGSSAPARSHALLLVTLVAALGGFLFGYDTAVVNGANPYLAVFFHLTPAQQGMAGASAILGCIPGAMLAGFFSDWLGRRRVLFVCALLYAASGLLSAIPRTFAEFLGARFISGLGIGASSMICPVYIAELAPASRRGRLGSLFQLGIVTGIFLTLFINAKIHALGNETWDTTEGWRWMLGAEVLPAFALLGLLIPAPESPRWLTQAGRENEAARIVEKITGKESAEREIAAIRATMREESGRFSELFEARFRRPLLVAVGLMAFSQLSGINAIMYYSTTIFAAAGGPMSDAFTSTMIVGLVNLLFTLVAIAFVDRAGRRSLLLIGMAVQTLALAAVGEMFHAQRTGWPLLTAILVFIAAFAMALGPVPWILSSEIFPTRVRGRAMSLATFTIWTVCYIVAQTFPVLNSSHSIGPARIFWIYALCSLAGWLFVRALAPETKGRTLEEIEQSWSREGRAPASP